MVSPAIMLTPSGPEEPEYVSLPSVMRSQQLSVLNSVTESVTVASALIVQRSPLP